MRTARGFVKLSQQRPLASMTWIGLAFRPLTPDEMTAASALLSG
jgi:hypothetical protein